LRVVPSSINVRRGSTVPITVHALRQDGFRGDITLSLVDAPAGFALSGGWIPADANKARVTLTAPREVPAEPFTLRLAGRAKVGDREIRRRAVAAEDMMQAFLYRHLVPARELLLASIPSKWAGPSVRLLEKDPVRIPVGGTAQVRFRTPGKKRQNDVELVLNEPPEGLSIQKTSPVEGGVDVLLKADAESTKPGLKGNLVVDAFTMRQPKDKDGTPKGKKRRVPLGPLPAVSFEVVQR
jgi:hypothetical protein